MRAPGEKQRINQVHPNKKNRFLTSDHHAFSHRPTFEEKKQGRFFRLSAHFDPTLIQHFIQLTHIIFFPLSA